MQDFTRIAESDPIMWEGILSLNKKNVLNELTKLNLEIENLKTQQELINALNNGNNQDEIKFFRK